MSQVTKKILANFAITGDLVEIKELKRGHIHETFSSIWKQEGGLRRYVHQHINHRVFKDVPLVMRNIETVVCHLRKKIAEGTGPKGETTLTLIAAKDGKVFTQDEEGEFWRTYEFVENTKSIDYCTEVSHAYEAARAFGRFTRYLSDLPSNALREGIPNFQSSVFRFEQLDQAIKLDPVNRTKAVKAELEFAVKNRPMAELLAAAQSCGELPVRNTHSDPKVNNVLFDLNSGEAVCVVDLDTCMPGTVLFDFGDLARTSSVAAAEDERDLSKVSLNLELFDGVARGFLEECGDLLCAKEAEMLFMAPRLLSLNLGVRFLTDYINGDTYFKIQREKHNLDRARCQFQVVRAMEENAEGMVAVVERYFTRVR